MPNSHKVQILVGADPELFLKDKKSEKFISAHDILQGTKKKPFPVHKGAVQVDGVAAEFNIDPANNSNVFVENIQTVMKQLGEMLPTAELVTVPAVVFEPTYFSKLPSEVRTLGCNVDFNAWTGVPNPAPKGEITTMRTGAGHIHVSWTKGQDPSEPSHFRDCMMVARQMDYYLGVPSLIWDQDNRRRELYGKAGAFRPKSYGIEYRVLSNRWLINEALMVWVWNAAFYSIHSMLNGGIRLYEKYGEYARELIDGNKYDEVLNGKFRKEVFTSGNVSVAWPKW